MLERGSQRMQCTVWMPVLLALCFAGTVTARQRPSPLLPGAPASQANLGKLAEGVFAQIVSPDSDAASNSCVVVLDSGALIFDTHLTPEAGEALLEKVKTVTARPVRYLVNSHFHPDHTHGNQAFTTARQIIGSSNTRRDMLQRDLPSLNRVQLIAQSQVEQLNKDLSQEPDAKKQEALRSQLNSRQAFMHRMAALKILAPWMTFDDSLSIIDGGREVQLFYFGIGHTDGDVVLYLPEEKIAFLGDIFFNDAIPNVEDANMLEWTKTLGEVLKLDAKTYVPGHGQVGARSDVERFLNYLEDLKALVEPAVARGDTLEQLIRDLHVPPKYASYSFQSFFPANLQKMYTELKTLRSSSSQEAVKKQGPLP